MGLDSIEHPTPGEIARILARIEQQQSAILDKLEANRVEAAQTYVRQDVYMRAEMLANAQVADVRTDIATVNTMVESDRRQYKTDKDAEAASRRTFALWLGGVSISVLLTIGTLIVSVATR